MPSMRSGLLPTTIGSWRTTKTNDKGRRTANRIFRYSLAVIFVSVAIGPLKLINAQASVFQLEGSEPDVDATYVAKEWCETGAQLVSALVDVTVAVIRIPTSINMTLADWAPYTLPVPLNRNVTLLGVWPNKERWPVLDCGFLRGMLALAPSVFLNISRMVVWNGRYAPHFQAPGLDLVTLASASGALMDAAALQKRSPSGAALPRMPTVFFSTGALVHRTCLPPAVSRLSFNSLVRPAEYPGPQLSGRINQSVACLKTARPRSMRDCWPSMGLYRDVATYAMDVDMYDTQIRAGYIMLVNMSFSLCDAVMTDSCIDTYGLLGCFYYMFPKGDVAPAPPAHPQLTDTAGGGGSRWQPQDSRVSMELLIGLLIGGCVMFLGLFGSLVALVVRNRWQRQRQQKPQHECDSAAAADAAIISPHRGSGACGRQRQQQKLLQQLQQQQQQQQQQLQQQQVQLGQQQQVEQPQQQHDQLLLSSTYPLAATNNPPSAGNGLVNEAAASTATAAAAAAVATAVAGPEAASAAQCAATVGSGDTEETDAAVAVAAVAGDAGCGGRSLPAWVDAVSQSVRQTDR